MKTLIIITIVISSIFVMSLIFILIGMIVERRKKRKEFNKDLEDYYTKYDKQFEETKNK